jgi:DNA-binding XRE family transcriptional regulator
MKPEDITPAKMKEIRKKKGLSQRGLAAELDISERQVKYKESGNYAVNRLLAYAIIGLQIAHKKRR